MLQEGKDIAALVAAHKLSIPVLAIGAGSGEFTFATQHMPPTNREIGHALGITSTGHINYHLKDLEKKGLIERETRKSRGIKLTKSQTGIPN